MTLTECQSFLLRLTAVEDNTKIREERILNLEARLDEAQVELQETTPWSQKDSEQHKRFHKRVNESKDEDCCSLVRDVLTRNSKLPQDEVSNMKLCGAHRLGKPDRNRARPLIARFTCRADRGRVWKARYRLKNSRISMGEDLPRHIQEIRKNVLITTLKKIKQETPSHKAPS